MLVLRISLLWLWRWLGSDCWWLLRHLLLWLLWKLLLLLLLLWLLLLWLLLLLIIIHGSLLVVCMWTGCLWITRACCRHLGPSYSGWWLHVRLISTGRTH